ncbi:unnamed protein product [Leuciscus chuanchicus]
MDNAGENADCEIPAKEATKANTANTINHLLVQNITSLNVCLCHFLPPWRQEDNFKPHHKKSHLTPCTLPYHRASTVHISHLVRQGTLKPACSLIGTKALPPTSNSTVILQTNYLTSSRLRANLSTAAEQKPPSLQGKETTPCRHVLLITLVLASCGWVHTSARDTTEIDPSIRAATAHTLAPSLPQNGG